MNSLNLSLAKCSIYQAPLTAESLESGSYNFFAMRILSINYWVYPILYIFILSKNCSNCNQKTDWIANLLPIHKILQRFPLHFFLTRWHWFCITLLTEYKETILLSET